MGTTDAKKTTMAIAGIVLAMLLVGGLIMVLAPMLAGVGTKAATALSVTTETAYLNSSEALSETTSAGNDIMAFLPWFGVGLAVLAFVISKKGIKLGI